MRHSKITVYQKNTVLFEKLSQNFSEKHLFNEEKYGSS